VQQRASDLAIIQPILAAQRAEIKELKGNLAEDSKYTRQLQSQLSTAREKLEIIKADYLAPDKEGGK